MTRAKTICPVMVFSTKTLVSPSRTASTSFCMEWLFTSTEAMESSRLFQLYTASLLAEAAP